MRNDDLIATHQVVIEIPATASSEFDEGWGAPEHGGVAGQRFTLAAQVELEDFPFQTPGQGGRELSVSGNAIFRHADLAALGAVINDNTRILSITSTDGVVVLTGLALFVVKRRRFGINLAYVEIAFSSREPSISAGA